MKKSNLVIIVFLIALAALGWLSQITGMVSGEVKYSQQLRQAEEYSQKGLYQKAINCYNEALSYRETKSVRELWAAACENAYLDQAIGLSGYQETLSTMCQMFPEESASWEKLLSTYMENDDINGAYSCYKQFIKAGAESDLIQSVAKDILYAYDRASQSYDAFIYNATGYYTVFNGDKWGVIESNGNTVYDCIYTYMSPYNENNDALFVSQKGQRIEDFQEVVQAKLDITFQKTGTYSDGLLPVCAEDGTWQYLDCATNTYLAGRYENASNYMNGTAAVYDSTGWKLIDTAGNQVCDTVFTDIKLHSNGNYAFGGVMIAKTAAGYGIYDVSGKPLCDFKAKDMDIYMGGAIAYQGDAGTWGYVNTDGSEELEASFACAKSFSGGMAAVSNGQQWGFVDNNGAVVIKESFAEADYFTDQGACMVSADGESYYLIKLRFS